MRLIKAITVIEYNATPEGLNLQRKLIKALTNDSPPNLNVPISQGLEMKAEKDKMFIAVNDKKTGIELNQPVDLKSAITGISNFYEKLSPIVNWSKINRIGVRTMWIDEYGMRFDEFIPYFKSKIFKDSALLKTSDDVGFSLSFKNDDSIITLNSGPMNKKQLLESALPPAPCNINDLPEVFAFIDIDYTLRKEQDFSNSMLKSFVMKATDYSQNKAHKLFNELK